MKKRFQGVLHSIVILCAVVEVAIVLWGITNILFVFNETARMHPALQGELPNHMAELVSLTIQVALDAALPATIYAMMWFTSIWLSPIWLSSITIQTLCIGGLLLYEG